MPDPETEDDITAEPLGETDAAGKFAVTVPPTWTTFSCPPEQMIANYNVALRQARKRGVTFEAYLFWGAEYWLARQRAGDPSYLQAFARVLDQA